MSTPDHEILALGCELSEEDRLALELLHRSRERRDIDILEAAKHGLKQYQLEDARLGNAAILGEETVALYKRMRKIGKLITPPLLNTAPEFIRGSYLSEGYAFEAEHERYGKTRRKLLHRMGIHRQVKDRDTGVLVSRPMFFVYPQYQGFHPISAKLERYTTEPYPHRSQIVDEEQLLEPIALIKLARQELKG